MSTAALTLKVVPRTYAELRNGVRETLLVGQRRVEEAKVRTYWETGRMIDQHLLLHKNRADYGAEVIRRLAGDLQIHYTVLYRCLRFARAFPIVAARQQLSWAHYRALLQIGDKSQRKKIEAEAAKNGWTSRELEERIRPVRLLNNVSDGQSNGADGNGTRETRPSENGSSGGSAEPMTPKRGTPGIYKIIADAETLSVDLGFTSYLDLTPEQSVGLKDGSLVRLDAKGKFLAAPDAKTSDLFTYPAEVIRVVDGDTLWMKIYLRPRHWLKEKLRLRALDCPEMDTPEGKIAKQFVDSLVSRTAAVTITTTKPDKYDRYLSDIYLKLNSGEEIFLNNALLENGHAIRKDSYSPQDWEKTDEAK